MNGQEMHFAGALHPGEFLKDKIPVFLLQASGMMALCVFLRLTGYEKGGCVLILICWALAAAVWTLVEYHNRKQYFSQMGQVLDKVDQRFLLGELMPPSFRLEDRLYREMIRRSNKSVIERIRQIEDGRQEYREYIESWVHEIKAPITSISLMCENHRNEGLQRAYAEHKKEHAKSGHMGCEKGGREQAGSLGAGGAYDDRIRRIALENQKVENDVDMVLYYARSDEVYKDYVIRETDLQAVAEEAVMKNKYDLIQNRIQVDVECVPEKVCTDRKWILFILNQLILNSAKYRAKENPHIWISSEKYGHGIRLSVKDNGAGIQKEDLPRIFEKGFTGNNGRFKNDKATGMGLYLCRKLCGKLGIGIRAESEYGCGTEVLLDFPVSSFVQRKNIGCSY